MTITITNMCVVVVVMVKFCLLNWTTKQIISVIEVGSCLDCGTAMMVGGNENLDNLVLWKH